METASQALLGINDPEKSFQSECIVTMDALAAMSPQTLQMVLRSLLWVGAHIAIDQPTALARTVEMMNNAVQMSPPEREAFSAQLAKQLFNSRGNV